MKNDACGEHHVSVVIQSSHITRKEQVTVTTIHYYFNSSRVLTETMIVLRQKQQFHIWSPNMRLLNIWMKSMPTLSSSQNQSSGPLAKKIHIVSVSASSPLGLANFNPIYS